jgi:hypothetical protein
MGMGMAPIPQNPSGLVLQWVVGGDNAVPLTHRLTAIGLSPSAFDGVNLLLAVTPATTQSSGDGDPLAPLSGAQPVKAGTPATVPAGAAQFHVTDVAFNSLSDAEKQAGTKGGTDFHTIAKDDGKGDYVGSWHDASATGDMSVKGSHADPLCYTRSGTADGNVYMTFDVNISSAVALGDEGDRYVIEAVDTDTNKTVGSGNATADYGQTLHAIFSSAGSADTVFRGQCNLEWLVEDKTTGTWANAGTTSDKVYVTNANPDAITQNLFGLPTGGDAALNSAGGPNTSAFVAAIPETVLDIGCRSAVGATTSAVILSGVWATFAAPASGPPQVADARGNVMTYWGAHSGPLKGNLAEFFTTAGLCKFDDGRCQSWTQMLVAVLAAQGITAKQVEITANATSIGGRGLSRTQFDVQPALPAQGNPKPFSRFPNHYVVVLSGTDTTLTPYTIYDPSYGQKYAVAGATTFTSAEQAWETASVADVIDSFPVGPPVTTPVTAALITGPPALFSFHNLFGVSI